jgi:heterogeneous nuclear ribonucleoprotein F/H
LSIDCDINEIHLTITRDGRPSGEAYVEMTSHDDLLKGLKCNKKMMGSRYIEVFKSEKTEMEASVKMKDQVISSIRSNDIEEQEKWFYVRLRGVPFTCTLKDVMEFMEGIKSLYDCID